MANPRPDIHHGHHNGVSSSSSQGGQPPPTMAFTRPFTLYEALPYTPFSSIAPFDSGRFSQPHECGHSRISRYVQLLTHLFLSPGIIPSPSISSASPAPPVTDLVPGNDFAALNQEATTHNLPYKHVQQAVSQIQHLLERGNIPEL